MNNWMIFSKTDFENIKISCISTPFKKEISLLSHVAKKLQPVNICKTAYSSQGCVNNMVFGLILEKKIKLYCP